MICWSGTRLDYEEINSESQCCGMEFDIHVGVPVLDYIKYRPNNRWHVNSYQMYSPNKLCQARSWVCVCVGGGGGGGGGMWRGGLEGVRRPP